MERKSFFFCVSQKMLAGETFFSRKRVKILDGVSMMNVTSLVVWANQLWKKLHVSFRYVSMSGASRSP